VKIQLAFQGGGAKIVSLLAVAEAIQKLQLEKRLEIKRVSGTSAGAIVGAFLAAGVNIVEVRAELAAAKAAELVSAFPRLGFIAMARKAWWGSSFWSTKSLRDWLNTVFGKVDVRLVGDCRQRTGTELVIMSTNLTDSVMVTSSDTEVLVTALMDSCALPFCFRPFSKTDATLIVDGGIGENLPVEKLSREVNEYGEIFAISFPPVSPGTPRTAQSYAAALLNTSMNASVARARAALTKNRLYEIKTEIGTFDFGKITKKWFENEYPKEYKRALEFFSALKVEAAEIDPWTAKEPVLKRIMADLAALYDTSEANRPFIYEEVVLEATAYCLLDLENGRSRADRLKCRMVFRPARDPVAFHAISLAGFGAKEYRGRIDPKLWDGKNRLIRCTVIPSLPSGIKRAEQRQVLLFFEEFLTPSGGPYTLEFQDEALQIMGPLRDTGQDEVGLKLSRVEGKIGRVIIALHVPNTRKDIKIRTAPAGRKPTGDEIRRLDSPPFFRSLAWAADGVESSEVKVEYCTGN
jgi:NTE family protein